MTMRQNEIDAWGDTRYTEGFKAGIAERDRLRSINADLLAAAKAANDALRRWNGPELGKKGRDFGLLDTLQQSIARAEGK